MTTNRPNIVLVSIDSIRADHCGFMGYEEDTTPTLDEMAAAGTVFENATAPGPSTPESMPVIFTGEYPAEHESNSDGAGADAALATRRERIRTHMEARDTLPERLSRLGYSMAAFTPNPFTSRHFGFDQGFDRFRDFMDRSHGSLYDRIFQGFLEGSGTSSMARVLLNFWQREEVFKPWETYYDEVVEWARQATEPYFLWVFLMDAHNPYMAGSGHRSQSRLETFHANYRFWRDSHETPFSPTVHDRLVTAYDDAIKYSDAFLERLQSDLAADDPLIAVHGDHGEAFGEHGTYGHEPHLYDENIHVPLVISDDANRTVTDPVSLRTLPALLHDIAAGDSRENRTAASEGIGAATRVFPTENAAVSRTDQGNRISFRGRQMKCIWNGNDNDAALYDLTDGERRLSSDGNAEHEQILTACRAAVEVLATDRRERRLIREAVDAFTENCGDGAASGRDQVDGFISAGHTEGER